jgi:hypothetical protein
MDALRLAIDFDPFDRRKGSPVGDGCRATEGIVVT